MCGLRLPVGAGAFPEVITVCQRRRTHSTLMVFLPYCYFPTISSSMCLPQRFAEVGPFLMPSTQAAEFPYSADFAGPCECSSCLRAQLSSGHAVVPSLLECQHKSLSSLFPLLLFLTQLGFGLWKGWASAGLMVPEPKIASQELRQGTFLSSFPLELTLAPGPGREDGEGSLPSLWTDLAPQWLSL